MDPTKKPLQHKPTDDLISQSLGVAAKIHDQERALVELRETLDGHWDDDRGESTPSLKDEIQEAEKVIAQMERDLVARRIALSGKVKTQGEILTRIVEGERALAQYHTEYKDILTAALKGFPV
jgi:hypothetical protein